MFSRFPRRWLWVALVLSLSVGVVLADNPPTTCVGTNDADFDGVPDECDKCPGFDDTLDADNDTVPDACDRCDGYNDNAGEPDSLRPSLLLSEAELPALRARLKNATTTTGQALYQNLVSRADLLKGMDPATPTEFAAGAVVTGYDNRLRVLSFAYLMNEGPQPEEYFCSALRHIDAMLDYDPWLSSGCGLTRDALIRGLAFAYDWLYDDLPNVTRSAIVDRLRSEVGNTTDTTPRCGSPNSFGSYHQLVTGSAWWHNRPWQNHQASALAAIATAGYALEDDLGAEATSWVTETARRFDLIVENNDPTYPTLIRSPDGGDFEGLFYGRLWHEWSALYYMLREDLDQTPYPADLQRMNAPGFLIHNTLPDQRTVYTFGDFSGDDTEKSYLDGQITMLANARRHYGDTYAQQRIDDIIAQGDQLTPNRADPTSLLAYDETLSSESLKCLPTEAEFTDIGIATMRNRWNDTGTGQSCGSPSQLPTDQFVGFKSGWPAGVRAMESVDVDNERGLNNGHAQNDQNSFVYADGSDLFLHDYASKVCGEPIDFDCLGEPDCPTTITEAGTYCTAWHNTITVVDDEAMELGQVWTRCLEIDRFDESTSDDIGWRCGELFDDPSVSLSPSARWNAFQADTGQFRTNFADPDFKWVGANGLHVYDPRAGLVRFDRDIVFTDQYAILFDRIDTQHDVNWYFHTPGSVQCPESLGGVFDLVYTSASSTNQMTQTVLSPPINTCSCERLTNDPDVRTLATRENCDVSPSATVQKPDTEIKLTADGMGPIEFVSVLRGPSGAASTIMNFQKNANQGLYRITIRNQHGSLPASIDTVELSRAQGLRSFLRQ